MLKPTILPLLAIVALLGSLTQAEELSPLPKFTLTEKSLIKVIHQDSPDIRQIEALYSQTKYDEASLNKKYQAGWVTNAYVANSSEAAIASFAPTFGPIYEFSTGIQKAFPLGLNTSVKLVTNQQSSRNRVIDEATRTGLVVNISMDLWKNLFGRLDRAELGNQVIAREKARIQTLVNKHIVELNLRKIYWSLVANDAKLKIAQDQLATSEKQLRDTRRRRGQFTADAQEFARYSAQVESRKTSISSLKFQRGILVQNLKKALPALAGKNIIVGDYDTDAKVDEVLVCAVRLGTMQEVPWDNTHLDTLIGLVEENYKRKRIVSDRYSDVDLQMVGEFRANGVDRGFSDSFSEFTSNSNGAYSLGVKLTVPLEGTASRAREAKISADYLNFQNEKNRLVAEIGAQHSQIAVLVKMLNDAVNNIKQNNGHLEKSIRASERKFRQARIPLSTLINDQDLYFNSRLNEIDTKLTVVHTLLDYFQTFTDDPCSINKIGA